MSVSLGDSLVVCSLERWDEVWRRNQFLVEKLLQRNRGLRVLFVEPAYDLFQASLHGQPPSSRGPQRVRGFENLWRLRPVKPLPRILGPASDAALRAQVRKGARALGFVRPTLWINDLNYAALASIEDWPTLYDITDDWLVDRSVSPRVRRRRRRLEDQLLRDVDEVVVCSPMLFTSRSRTRSVTLIPNGVDVMHFTRAQTRPDDLGISPTAVYVGTLHDERLDVELVCEVARALPQLTVTLVGPDALSAAARSVLSRQPNVQILGPRPYDRVPGYLQHADVVVVPHRINEFTESLDPIKAYECLAVGRPTVATKVAGFRGLPHPITTASRSTFAGAVVDALRFEGTVSGPVVPPASWEERSRDFERVLDRARSNQTRIQTRQTDSNCS